MGVCTTVSSTCASLRPSHSPPPPRSSVSQACHQTWRRPTFLCNVPDPDRSSDITDVSILHWLLPDTRTEYIEAIYKVLCGTGLIIVIEKANNSQFHGLMQLLVRVFPRHSGLRIDVVLGNGWNPIGMDPTFDTAQPLPFVNSIAAGAFPEPPTPVILAGLSNLQDIDDRAFGYICERELVRLLGRCAPPYQDICASIHPSET